MTWKVWSLERFLVVFSVLLGSSLVLLLWLGWAGVGLVFFTVLCIVLLRVVGVPD